MKIIFITLERNPKGNISVNNKFIRSRLRKKGSHMASVLFVTKSIHGCLGIISVRLKVERKLGKSSFSEVVSRVSKVQI